MLIISNISILYRTGRFVLTWRGPTIFCWSGIFFILNVTVFQYIICWFVYDSKGKHPSGTILVHKFHICLGSAWNLWTCVHYESHKYLGISFSTKYPQFFLRVWNCLGLHPESRIVFKSLNSWINILVTSITNFSDYPHSTWKILVLSHVLLVSYNDNIYFLVKISKWTFQWSQETHEVCSRFFWTSKYQAPWLARYINRAWIWSPKFLTSRMVMMLR